MKQPVLPLNREYLMKQKQTLLKHIHEFVFFIISFLNNLLLCELPHLICYPLSSLLAVSVHLACPSDKKIKKKHFFGFTWLAFCLLAAQSMLERQPYVLAT